MAGIIIQRIKSGDISLHLTFCNLLDYYLPVKGYTASKLALETGISTNTISKFRTGKTSINTSTFEKLINHLINQPDLFISEILWSPTKPGEGTKLFL